MAMMQMIPNISIERAKTVIKDSKYRNIKRVYDMMNDKSIPPNDRMLSMQQAFSQNTQRKEKKLSIQVYRLMTITDPDASIHPTDTTAATTADNDLENANNNNNNSNNHHQENKRKKTTNKGNTSNNTTTITSTSCSSTNNNTAGT
jgi:hypothetical protein